MRQWAEWRPMNMNEVQHELGIAAEKEMLAMVSPHAARRAEEEPRARARMHRNMPHPGHDQCLLSSPGNGADRGSREVASRHMARRSYDQGCSRSIAGTAGEKQWGSEG